MSIKTTIADRSPRMVRRAVREARVWYTLVRSPNKQFLRFAPPGHFYSPIPDIDLLRSTAWRTGDRSVRDVPGVDLNDDVQLAHVERFAETHAEIPFPEQPRDGCRYHLDNEWFSYGDCVALYSMMRAYEPRRIVEVGSGFSSAAMLEINDRFFGGRIGLTFIDPSPQRLLGLLRQSDTQSCTVLAQPVQEVDLEVFAALEDGDVLFIDSSHLAKAGSDVLHLLFRVLPLLRDGVLVHLHDIPWPFEYPSRWLEQGRAWNEAYVVRAFLQYNAAFEILYFGSYLEYKHRDPLERSIPLALRRPAARMTLSNSSLWLRKTRGR
ncbi:class I SAM-dependent methyltransferase [Pseudonocardia nigra]|uniref:class I SAM-dependent methyltransferase n=1 Tax=Pseudonocardia nigra TaxID=1921578 RepID=UPI001C5F0910|nr:class I SAM-dependent methyltransferase [Pseudonocardia nigra]